MVISDKDFMHFLIKSVVVDVDLWKERMYKSFLRTPNIKLNLVRLIFSAVITSFAPTLEVTLLQLSNSLLSHFKLVIIFYDVFSSYA